MYIIDKFTCILSVPYGTVHWISVKLQIIFLLFWCKYFNFTRHFIFFNKYMHILKYIYIHGLTRNS